MSLGLSMYVCVDACRELNAPETVGQYAVIFVYKDGKHDLASSVVSDFFFFSGMHH